MRLSQHKGLSKSTLGFLMTFRGEAPYHILILQAVFQKGNEHRCPFQVSLVANRWVPMA